MKLVLCFRAGTMRAIYNDALAPMLRQGRATVRRASHVEPCIADNTQWEADMSPVGGPKLAGFKTRKAALAAEIQYLETNVL